MEFLASLKAQLKSKKDLKLKVKVTPSAPRSEIFDQLADGTLKVRLQAPPENGKANKALLKLLQKEFNAEAEIISCETSSKKQIRLDSREEP